MRFAMNSRGDSLEIFPPAPSPRVAQLVRPVRWLKFKNPAAQAGRREAEEEWGR